MDTKEDSPASIEMPIVLGTPVSSERPGARLELEFDIRLNLYAFDMKHAEITLLQHGIRAMDTQVIRADAAATGKDYQIFRVRKQLDGNDVTARGSDGSWTFIPEFFYDIFIDRSIRTDRDRHADIKDETSESKTATKLPNRPTTQFIAEFRVDVATFTRGLSKKHTILSLDEKPLGDWSIHFARVIRHNYEDAMGDRRRDERIWNARKIMVVSVPALKLQSRAEVMAKLSAWTTQQLRGMADELQTRAAATALKNGQSPEQASATNITYLPARLFDCVHAPCGLVPMWLWVTHAIPQLRNGIEANLAAKLLARQYIATSDLLRYDPAHPPQLPEPQKTHLMHEIAATAQCLAARHMAYIKDTQKQAGDKKDHHTDLWFYPWHSPRMHLQEIDCEDGAILTFALASHCIRIAHLLRDQTEGRDTSQDTRSKIGAHIGLAQWLRLQQYLVPVFAIVTLRPPTDKSGSGWTYHAICMLLDSNWLQALGLQHSGKLTQQVKKEFESKVGKQPRVVIMDSSASQSCVWSDKGPSEEFYANLDNKAVPPEANLFVYGRHTWRQVHDAKIYGHVVSLVIPNSLEVVPMSVSRSFQQCNVLWKGKLGAPFAEVFMNDDLALSPDLQFQVMPSPDMASKNVLSAMANYQLCQPSLHLFREPRIEVDFLTSHGSRQEWLPEANAGYIGELLEPYETRSSVPVFDPETFQIHHREQVPAVLQRVPPADAPTTEQDAKQTAMVTLRTADYSPELATLLQRHNPDKDIHATDYTVLGDVAVTIVRIRPKRRQLTEAEMMQPADQLPMRMEAAEPLGWFQF